MFNSIKDFELGFVGLVIIIPNGGFWGAQFIQSEEKGEELILKSHLWVFSFMFPLIIQIFLVKMRKRKRYPELLVSKSISHVCTLQAAVLPIYLFIIYFSWKNIMGLC